MEPNVNKIVIAARNNLRVEDFQDHHVLAVECNHCGHKRSVSAATLRQKAKPDERILGITWKLRCRRCRQLGAVHWYTGEVVGS